MTKRRAVATVVWAVFAISAITAASASAATAGWMVNGVNLGESGTAALATLIRLDRPIIISSAGITYECLGPIHLLTPIILGRVRLERTLYLNCRVVAPAACSAPTTLLTVPWEAELTLDGATADKAIVRPTTGKVFTTIAISGTECAAAGNKPLTGDYEILMPNGQTEQTVQISEEKQGSTGLLKIGSEAASLEGSGLLLLESNQTWSFL